MMSKMKTGMYILDLIVVVGSALTLLWLVGYIQPLVIAPVDGLVTGNASLVFSFEKADRLYISTSRDFSDAQAITGENEKISLSPGTYYWKVEGLGESEIRMLTILDSVALEVRRHDGGIEVVNVGRETIKFHRIIKYLDLQKFTPPINYLNSSIMSSHFQSNTIQYSQHPDFTLPQPLNLPIIRTRTKRNLFILPRDSLRIRKITRSRNIQTISLLKAKHQTRIPRYQTINRSNNERLYIPYQPEQSQRTSHYHYQIQYIHARFHFTHHSAKLDTNTIVEFLALGGSFGGTSTYKSISTLSCASE